METNNKHKKQIANEKFTITNTVFQNPVALKHHL
jgi:hypothetical protein